MNLESRSDNNSNYLFTDIEIEEKTNCLIDKCQIEGEFPVPITKVLDYLGYVCYPFNPSQETMGISGSVNHETKKVHVNNKDSIRRQFFTIAHEIGHIVLHGSSNNYIDYRGLSTGSNEIQADKFAANLLMPKQVFIYTWKKFNSDLTLISNFFCVSKRAVISRAYYLGL